MIQLCIYVYIHTCNYNTLLIRHLLTLEVNMFYVLCLFYFFRSFIYQCNSGEGREKERIVGIKYLHTFCSTNQGWT